MRSLNSRLALLTLLILLATAHRASAWNLTGHEVIAEIAWKDLKPAVREKITAILKEHPHFKTYLITEDDAESPDQAMHIFMRASIWPDLVRTPRGNKEANYHHGNWHYIDFPIIAEGTDRAALELPPTEEKLQADKPPENAVQAMQYCLQQLKNPDTSTADKAVALAWLEHLVGDLHQPLHAASRFTAAYPKGDRGGNLFMVKFHGVITNLHLFWDERLGGYMSFKLVDAVTAKVAEAHPRASFEKEISITAFGDWAAESFALARDVVYAGGKLPGVTKEASIADKGETTPELPEKYEETANQIAQTRAALAGYRLADLLNKTLE